MDEQLIVDGPFDEEPVNLLGNEPSNSIDDLDVESLVEQIYNEVGGAVDRTVVDQIVQEMAARYLHAKIKAFVPIFVKRDAIDLLRRS